MFWTVPLPARASRPQANARMDDGRNQLFREYVRLLYGLKQKVFVMENVSGMIKGTIKLIFAEMSINAVVCNFTNLRSICKANRSYSASLYRIRV
jgi:site-specific DNA-cytosine methylase